MKMSISRLRRSPELLKGKDLPKSGGFMSQKRELEIMPDQVAIILTGGRCRVQSPSGKQPKSIEVDKSDQILLISRGMDVTLDIEQLLFTGGVQGRAQLWGRFRVLDSWGDGAHPLLEKLEGRLSGGDFQEALERSVSGSMSDQLSTVFAGHSYQADRGPHQISEILKQVSDEPRLREALQRQAGLALLRPLEAVTLQAPDLDEAWKSGLEEERSAQERRKQTGEVLAGISAEIAVDSARQQHILEQKKGEIQTAVLELEQEQIRAAQEIQKDLAREEVRIKEAQRRALEAEAAAREQELEQKTEEAERSRKQLEDLQHKAAAAQRRMESLERELARTAEVEGKLEVLQQTLEIVSGQIQPLEPEQTLELTAVWQAHNEQGVISPDLGSTATLPTGMMLSVKVLVSRDAYVYILLKGSTGKWQCLLPDLDGMMGISKGNLQQSGRLETWPGLNSTVPALPYWCLDEDPGTERLAVLASLEPIEIGKMLSQGQVERLKQSAKPTGVRGMVNPALMTSGQKRPESGDYHHFITAFSGQDCVIQETVITHV